MFPYEKGNEMSQFVYYHPQQDVDAGSYSLSPQKPQHFVDRVIAQYGPDVVQDFDLASADTIKLAHAKKYVDGVLRRKIKNGFGNTSQEVAWSLPYNTGSMLAAATYALGLKDRDPRVACSPTSGFHHAGYDFGGGFCTFNGLVITAMALKKAGLVDRVCILDCDYHEGNGTEDIINRMHLGSWLRNTSAGFCGFDHESEYLDWMNQNTLSTASGNFDLVLYQAGADAHIKDPLGGILSSRGMYERDVLAYKNIACAGIPVVWNLAGGYQIDNAADSVAGKLAPVLDLHMQTYQVFCGEEKFRL